VQAAAAEALEAVSGIPLGYELEAWKAWYAAWLKARPASDGPTVAPDRRGEEPPPHVTRSLHPSFYGLTLTAKDVVFVVDISGSVGSSGVDRARRQLTQAVALLGSDVQIAALFFSDEVHMWKKGALLPATPDHKEDLAKFLRGLAPGRRTDVYSPLNAGLKIVMDRVAEKTQAGDAFREPVALVLVSDGRDNMAAVPSRVVADKLDRLDPATSVVHAVVLGRDDSPLLAAIARLGGGHYVRADGR
jgi:Mg-chelatase subunit ChlD